MIEEIEAIENEQVDDIPLLIEVIKKMGLIEIFNEEIRQHGNWQGLGAGYIIAVWLAYILSEGDHRKSYLQEWVASREHTLLYSLDVEEINELDFTDDKLGQILNQLNDDQTWQRSERQVNEKIIRVYDLEAKIARVDTTTVSSYGRVTEEGLLQFGHSKDYRPDLGQVKIASVTLDPLGLPLVTMPVSGEQADDGLYLPVIKQAKESLKDRSGLLFVGDSKMGSLATRCQIAHQGDEYLMPLSRVQIKAEQLRTYLAEFEASPDSESRRIQLKQADETGQEQLVMEGFERIVELEQEISPHEKYDWLERRLVMLSPEYAQKQKAQLTNRLEETKEKLKQLVQKRRGYRYPCSQEELEERICEVLTASACQTYFQVTIEEETFSRNIRAYKERPARVETSSLFTLTILPQTDTLAQAYQLFGWRVYATNAPVEKLSFSQAFDVYRDAYLHEHGYSRLKGKPLSLTPMYLQKDDQITGLIRLLSLALRPLTLIEFVTRQQLAKEGKALQGIYAGNRRRKTRTPRTETLLRVFKGIVLTIIQVGGQERVHITPLTATQKRILQLIGLSDEVYSSLTPTFSKVILKSAN